MLFDSLHMSVAANIVPRGRDCETSPRIRGFYFIVYMGSKNIFL